MNVVFNHDWSAKAYRGLSTVPIYGAESELLSPDIVFFHPVDSVWDDECRIRPRLERESMPEIINGSRSLRRAKKSATERLYSWFS